MGQEFRTYVSEQKQERIGNLIGLSVENDSSSFTQEEIITYFKQKKINERTIKDFLLTQSEDFGLFFEGALTNIEEDGDGYEEILTEIRKQGPFTSPRELVTVIAEYIKTHMSYEAISMLDQLFKANIEPSEIVKYMNNPAVQLTEYHLKMLKEILGEYRGRESLDELSEEHFSESMKNMIASLLFYADAGDIEGLAHYINSVIVDAPEDFRKVIEVLSFEIEGGRGGISNSISGLLNDTKTGVCRHFSMIAKRIYNDIITSPINTPLFQGESEVLYVSSASSSHAYNVLIYEDGDGKIQKEYFDITNFLFKPHLFNPKDFLPADDELYVQNTNSPTYKRTGEENIV